MFGIFQRLFLKKIKAGAESDTLLAITSDNEVVTSPVNASMVKLNAEDTAGYLGNKISSDNIGISEVDGALKLTAAELDATELATLLDSPNIDIAVVEGVVVLTANYTDFDTTYLTFTITGDGTTHEFPFLHSLGTLNVAHEIFLNATMDTILADFIRIDVDNAKIDTGDFILQVGETATLIVWSSNVSVGTGGVSLPIDAIDVNVDSSLFAGNLTTAITDVQSALEEIDALVLGGGSSNPPVRVDVLSNVGTGMFTFASMEMPTGVDKFGGVINFSLFGKSATNESSTENIGMFTCFFIDGTLYHEIQENNSTGATSNSSELSIRTSYPYLSMTNDGTTLNFQVSIINSGTDTLTECYMEYIFGTMESAEIVVGGSYTPPAGTQGQILTYNSSNNLEATSDILFYEPTPGEIDLVVSRGTSHYSKAETNYSHSWVDSVEYTGLAIEAKQRCVYSEFPAPSIVTRIAYYTDHVNPENNYSENYAKIDAPEIRMVTGNTYFKQVGDVLTLLDAGTGKCDWQAPLLRRAARTFTPEEIRGFHTTKINLVEALGLNVLSDLHRYIIKYDYETAEYTGGIKIYLGDVILGSLTLNGTDSLLETNTIYYDTPTPANYINKAINVGASSAITGETATGTLTVIAYYTIEDFS